MIEGHDLELFRRSVDNAVATDDVDAALAELGWHDALADDERAAVSVLFELQGRATAVSSAVDAVILRALGVTASASVVMPALGSWDAPGPRGIATRGITRHRSAVVVTEGVASVVATEELELQPVAGLDPWLGLVTVSGRPARTVIGAVPWEAAVAAAHRALAHELIGVSRTMLELAREHALGRVQFGQPIAAFQAVRHRLAETLVAIETASAGLDAAWLDRSPQSAAMAKALAGRAARTAARHCQQVCAGIGFTTEHPLHRSIRRVLVLDELFGSARSLTRDLGEHLLASRRLPDLLPL